MSSRHGRSASPSRRRRFRESPPPRRKSEHSERERREGQRSPGKVKGEREDRRGEGERERKEGRRGEGERERKEGRRAEGEGRYRREDGDRERKGNRREDRERERKGDQREDREKVKANRHERGEWRGEADGKERHHRHRSRSPRSRQEREGRGREAVGEEDGQENRQRTDRFRSERFDGPGGADGMKQDLSGKDGDRRWRRDYRGSDSLGGPRERNFNRFRGSRGGGFGGPRESRFGGGDGGGFRDGGFRGGSRGGGFRGRGFGEFRGERRDEEDVDNRRLFESLTDPTEVPKLGNFFEHDDRDAPQRRPPPGPPRNSDPWDEPRRPRRYSSDDHERYRREERGGRSDRGWDRDRGWRERGGGGGGWERGGRGGSGEGRWERDGERGWERGRGRRRRSPIRWEHDMFDAEERSQSPVEDGGDQRKSVVQKPSEVDGKWTHDKFAELETVAMDTGT